MEQAGKQTLFGRQTVLEALNHEKPLDKIFIKKGQTEGALKGIITKAKERGVVVQEVDKARLDEMSDAGNHQGVLAVYPAQDYVEAEAILDRAKAKGEAPFVLLLDGIMDPRNFGAILRVAEAAGVHGVIIPKRGAVGLTSVVAKTSSGAIEHVLVSRVTNLNDAADKLKKAGLWITCADLDGQNLYEADLDGPVALVIGSEGEGVSRLLKKNADFTVKIPMFGQVQSLNASVAAGIMLYEVVRRRHPPGVFP
ncbi:MAG: 23S rRNA (guanosine(2251)-2'-O)-methyltransferase RlmB [Clostridiales bacterium]|jgi:23S rRNA (guanosine2251-2'-O)-methyltransferase|nr:23S rRNA (guanosine(2251)-2'-O)-methyltransferase RlmB [Clostridiales bacterium]